MISQRVARLGQFSLANLMAVAPDEKFIDLALGVPPGPPPEPLVEGAVSALRDGHHQYIEAAGLPELRVRIAEHLMREDGVRVDPSREITVTCGATEGLFAALLAVTDPGDEVILLEPFFENYRGTIELIGAVPKIVPLVGPGWRLDAAAVAAAVTPRTRAIVVSSPHNPTGTVFTRAELTDLLRICADHDLVCVADEVYKNFTFDGCAHTSLFDLAGVGERTVVLRSFSKALQVSGWRVGYSVADHEITAALRKAHVRTTLGSATPLQHALLRAGLDSDDWGVAHFRERRRQLVDGLRELGFEVGAPEGGWFVLAGTSGIGWKSDELAAGLAKEAGVLVAPATPFFADPAEGANWVRFCMVRDSGTTAEGLDRIGRFLAANSSAR